MTKTEAAAILARSARRAGITARDAAAVSAHLSEVAYTEAPDSLVMRARAVEPAMSTILRHL